MNKLKSFTSKLTSSTPGEKLSKAFKFDSNHNVLSRTGDPFHDGPVLEEPSLPRVHLCLHCACLFLTFLAICTMGGVAGFQAKWVGVSGGTGFTLFILILSFLLSAFLVITPLVYDRWDRLKRPAQFLHVARSTLILHAFGTGIMLLAAMIVTISAWTAKGCSNADEDPHADLGDDFKNGLSQWCTTKRASAIFDWMAFGCWLALLVLAALAFHRERRESRRREPAFIPPSDMTYAHGIGIGPGAGISNVSYSGVNTHAGEDEHERYDSEPKPADGGYGYESGYDTAEAVAVPARYHASTVGYEQPGYVTAGAGAAVGGYERPAAMSRVSGMSGNGGASEEPSRTMQLAYNASDPYAAIRSSLLSGQANSFNQPAQPATYNPAQPIPPQYGGYR